MEPPHLTAPPVPAAARALLASGKAGDQPPLPASGQTRPLTRQPSPLCIKTDGRDGTGFAAGGLHLVGVQRRGLPCKKPAGTTPHLTRPSAQMATWSPKSQQDSLHTPHPRHPPVTRSRAGTAEPSTRYYQHFPAKSVPRPSRPVPSPQASSSLPQPKRSGGGRALPGTVCGPPSPSLHPTPNPRRELTGAEPRRRRNGAELCPARLAL